MNDSPDSAGPAPGESGRTLPPEAAKFAALFDQPAVGIAEADVEGRFIRVNDRFGEIVGRDPQSLVGMSIADITHPDDLEENLRRYRRLLDKRTPFAMEKRFVRPDGSATWVQIFGNPVPGADGTVQSTIGVTLDVTEQKHAEADLRESEARLKHESDQFGRMFAQAPSMMALLRGPDHVFELANPGYMQLIGHRDPIGKPVREALPEVVEQGFIDLLDRVYSTGEALVGSGAKVRLQRAPDAPLEERFLDFVYQPLTDSRDEVVGIFVEATDVTERKRSEELRAAQSRVLELAIQDSSLEQTLEALVRAVEAQSPVDLLGSILLLDDDATHLRHGAAPSLPDAYNQAIDGLAIGAAAGSCGTAAHGGKPVYVSDIDTDPLWKDYRDLAREHGLRACWSTPILSSQGKVLGTFAMYYRQPRAPVPEDLELVEFVTRSAAIVIERKRAEEALRESEERLRLVIDGATDYAILTTDPERRITSWSSGAAKIFGYSADEAIGACADMLWTPEDRAKGQPEHEVETARRAGCANNERWHQRADGSRVFLNGSVHPLPPYADGRERGFIKVARDETSRRHAEAALSESEERFRNMADHAPVMMWVTDANGSATYLNQSWFEFTGQSEREALGQGWLAAIHPDDAAKTERAFLDANRKQEAFRVEYRLRRHDGDHRWVIDAATPRFGTNGEFAGFIGSVFEIDQRKRAEVRRSALIELGDRFRDLDDPADIAYAAAEILGRTLDVSRAGYGTIDPVAETITIERDWNAPGIKTLAGVLHFRDYGSYIEDLKRGETVVFADAEKDPRTAETADALKAISAQAVVNMPITEQGGFVALLYLNHEAAREWTADELDFVRDIAERTRTAVERRRAEEALREESQRLEILNRTGAAVSGELDLQKVVQMVTDAGVELSGAEFGAFFYNVINPAGESYMLYTLSGADRSSFDKYPMPRNTAVFGPTFDGAGVVRSDDITKDPRYGKNPPYNGMPKDHLPVCSYLAVPVIGRSGEVVGGLFFGHPKPARFTEAHERLLNGIAAQAAIAIDNARLYQAVQRANETLEQRVDERTTELERANEALRQAQKMEAIGQLTGGIAHDFNNMLTVIRGSADVLNRRDLDEERRRRYLQAITDTSDRAARLTGQLLAFARRQALKPEVFDAAERVDAIADMLHTVLGSPIRLVIESDCDDCFIETDAAQFETALVNMAVNGRDAMDGEGELRIRIEAPREVPAALQASGAGPYVAVSVSDSGHGIAADDLDKIFEPFFTTKETGKGTGLGLSQVYGFAKQSGGEVVVDSELERGTTFTLFLPRAPEGHKAVETAKVQLDDLRRGGRVLVVEDNEEVGIFAEQVLGELGFDARLAGDGEEALAILDEDDAFDIVFTDVVMPGVGGIELARQIRERWPDLPVVLTSGYSHVLASRAEHAFPLLHKPYSLEGLAKVLGTALARRDEADLAGE